MNITKDMIFKGQSRNGAWSKKQLRLLGVDWPPVEGWINKEIKITPKKYEQFLELKDKHLKNLCPLNL